ncbi:MAG: LPP20 family lipoprotein [Bacteroidota bacterium]
MKSIARPLRIAGLLTLLAQGLGAQPYPKWFVHQGDILCKEIAVGYANPSFYPDSAVSEAVRNGTENYVRQQRCSIAGGQAFWSTEIGTFWMGENFKERFDTSAVETAAKKLEVIKKYISRSIVLVLLSSSDSAGIEIKEPVESKQLTVVPQWIGVLPSDSEYIYAVGMAPKYFYERSSWIEAERMARRNLARSVYVDIKALQKMGRQGQEIQNEELSISLKNIEVVSRWRDVNKGIFYMLLKMPIR